MKTYLHAGSSPRRGFTLVETMIASGIGLVILLSVATCFIFSHRMLRVSMSECEQSLSSRLERERAPMFKAFTVLYDSGIAQ